MAALVLLAVLLLAGASSASTVGEVVPYKFPLFKQALNGRNITIEGQASNPGVLNNWLRQNDGYDQDNDLQEEVVYKIAPSRIKYVGPLFNNTSIAPKTLKQMLQKEGTIVIANVMAGHHFVLVVGFDSGDTNWYVNDPGFERNSYTYADIVGYRIFQML